MVSFKVDAMCVPFACVERTRPDGKVVYTIRAIQSDGDGVLEILSDQPFPADCSVHSLHLVYRSGVTKEGKPFSFFSLDE